MNEYQTTTDVVLQRMYSAFKKRICLTKKGRSSVKVQRSVRSVGQWVCVLMLSLLSSSMINLCYAQSGQPQDDLLSAPRGLYLGVKPGEQNYAPGKKLSPEGDVQRIVWIGFQARRDRAQVFVQTDSRPIFEIAESNPLRVVIDFPNARLHTTNEGRTLDAAFFPTVVRSLKARQISRNLVRLVIKLREPARYRKKTDAKFLHLLFDSPKEPIDVIAEYEREMDQKMKNSEAIEYKRPN